MSQKIVDLINAVKERRDKKEIIEKVYVDNCPYYEKMVDANNRRIPKAGA